MTTSTPLHRYGPFLALCVAVACAAGCIDGSVRLVPGNGAVESGTFLAEVHWTEGMDPASLVVSQNNEDITGVFELIPNFAGARMTPLPGKKILTAQMVSHMRQGDLEVTVPFSATSIYTATSELPREGFAGGALAFQCADGFLHSPVQVPGLDLDAGFLEQVCNMLPVSGLFPGGDAAFPKDSVFPLLYGVFPRKVTFREHGEVPNAIGLSPIDLTLGLGDVAGGEVCELSAEMDGMILPVAEDPEKGEIVASMVQTLKQVSLSVMRDGACEPVFTSPEDVELMTFNYVARR